jgi:hypothetical protein
MIAAAVIVQALRATCGMLSAGIIPLQSDNCAAQTRQQALIIIAPYNDIASVIV